MPETRTIQYGATKITYTLVYVKRKTLGITVDPDLRISARAPKGISTDVIDALMLKRAPWILDKIQELRDNPLHIPPRDYISGETHYFLGKPYRLQVIQSPKDIVKQERDTLKVYVQQKDPARVKQVLDDWYRKMAQSIFTQRLAKCYLKVVHLGIPFPVLAIRMMKSSWGNARGNKITLNVKLVRMPVEGIDLVIFHELCHLAEPNHSKRFYALMEQILPDWEERRARLQEYWVV